MKNIYNFEKEMPPAVTESILAEELDRRRSKKAAIVTAISGVFAEILLVVLGFVLLKVTTLLAVMIFIYAAAGAIGMAVIIPTALKKERSRQHGYN